MDKRHCALQDVLIGMDQMALKLHKVKFFADRPYLASTRKKSTIATSSVWRPPPDTEISAFLRHLRRDVVSSFVDSPLRRNYMWLDCKAIQWLKQHKSEIVIADADKGLGDVLLPRSWVSAELDRLLRTGFRRLSETEYASATFDARCTMESATRQMEACGVISTSQARFICNGLFSKREGSFRLTVKLHKCPMVGRPISNLSHSWIAPASLFLCDMLSPLQRRLPHVVSSSDEFLRALPQKVPMDFELATIDIKNLYPSIHTEHLLKVLRDDILDFYDHNAKARYTICVLELVLQNQYILHRGECYQAFGIATGVPPGVFLANIYVGHLDAIVHQEHADHLAFFKTFVDDAVCCASNINAVHDSLNSWRGELVWEITGRGGRIRKGEPSVAFLDVQLSHCNGVMHWAAFRKPLNRYLYLPKASCHPSSVSSSIIRGETYRMWRINKSRCDLLANLQFFARRLAMRGYAFQDTWATICKTLAKLEASGRSCNTEHRKFFLVLKYSSSVPAKVLKSCFSKHARALKGIFKHDVSLHLAFTVQRNAFRLHYHDNWR